jgi:DNA repair exonuclease SbcCD ATPase subunit
VRLRGKNFQSWAEFDLNIDGLTIITGPSDTGKSAIFRALKGVLRNELPADFVRDGQNEPMLVEAEHDGHRISAQRSRKGSTTYVIDGSDYAKLAKAVPDDLAKLKFGEVIIGEFDIDPIFGRQNSAQFLIDPLTYKPTEVNAVLGAFGGTEKLEHGKKEANLRKTQKDAEARTIAGQIREAEERKAALEVMSTEGKAISEWVGSLSQDVVLLEMDIEWLESALACRNRLAPLRRVLDALVLPDITGLEELHKLVLYAEQAAEAGAYAKWLVKPSSTLYSVSISWNDVRVIWNEIIAVEAAVEAGKHVVSTDRLKTSLSDVEGTYSDAVRDWRGIRLLEDLSVLLRDITDSAEQLAGVEIELSAAQAELRKGLCPRCGKAMEHLCA